MCGMRGGARTEFILLCCGVVELIGCGLAFCCCLSSVSIKFGGMFVGACWLLLLGLRIVGRRVVVGGGFVDEFDVPTLKGTFLDTFLDGGAAVGTLVCVALGDGPINTCLKWCTNRDPNNRKQSSMNGLTEPLRQYRW